MSDFEIQQALQLRQQRFTAALALYLDKEKAGYRRHSMDEAIALADELIEKLEAPTK